MLYGTSKDELTSSILSTSPQSDIVIKHRGRLSRTEALTAMCRADALLLVHSDGELGPETIPSKVYEYFWVRRPVFAVTNRNPFLDDMVRRFEGFVCSEHDETSIIQALNECHHRWESQTLHSHTQVPIGVDDAVSSLLDRVNLMTTSLSD